MCSVWSNSACEYQAGPGMSSTLSFAPPYFLAKSGVKTLSGGSVPFLISGSTRAGHPGAVLVRRVDQQASSPWSCFERALVAPQVDPVAERVADVADDVARVLGGDLLAQGRPVLPGLRDRVAEGVHLLLVDPEHHLGQVVLDADQLAVVDTYGGAAPHGGGAFSGKDPTKVDRSAAYAARYLAKNIVAAGLARRCTIQLAYAIGISEPLSLYVDTHGTGTVDDEAIEAAIGRIGKLGRLTPRGIRTHLGLNKPIYQQTAAYGHFGRKSEGDFFPWERVDLVQDLKAAVAA